jgi:branched-chain amino acid transport system substrate-binding protein
MPLKRSYAEDLRLLRDTPERVGFVLLILALAAFPLVARTIEAYFKMLNETGGINGRKVEVVVRDDAYTPARTVAAVKELIEKEKVFIFSSGLGTLTNLA